MTTKNTKHDSSDFSDARLPSGSYAAVPANRFGITDPAALAEAEAQALMVALETLINMYHGSYKFTAADIQAMHSIWLGGIYEGAGELRCEDLSGCDLHYAPARQVPKLMASFEKTVLAKHTPCSFLSAGRMLQALAEVHAELVLIHPFQYGTERVAMLLTTLMALQAGLPILNFKEIITARSAEYAEALKAALDEDYEPMKLLFQQVVAASMKGRRLSSTHDA